MDFKKGDKVIFLVPFENAVARVESGNIGIVKSESNGFVFVIAKSQMWMCKRFEIVKT